MEADITLMELLEGLPDPRAARGKRHPLPAFCVWFFVLHRFSEVLDMTKRSFVFALGLVAVLTASQARAGSITTLYSTGVDSTHALLASGALDSHYVMASGSSDGTTGLTPFVSLPAPGSPPWAPNTSTAQWITPKAPEPVNGAYNFTTTFDLTGFLPGTAVITGKVGADDELVGVLLNGVAVTPAITTPDQGYASTYSFSITSGFTSDVNSLEFLTMNTHGGSVGLFVDMTGTASAIPEPASMALLGIGLGGLFTLRRFFKRTSVA